MSTTTEQLIAEARWLVAMQQTEYQPFDREQKLGADWKFGDPEVLAWEDAHGHDPRLKCYPEFGCQVLEAPWAILVKRLADALEAARDELAGTHREWAETLLLAGETIAERDALKIAAQPRQVVSVEELDALPVMSLIMEPGIGFHLWKRSSGWESIGGVWFPSHAVRLPARLLFTPTQDEGTDD